MPTKIINIHAPHQGLFDFTQQVASFVSSTSIGDGLCTLFVQHTSASLVIQENADLSAKMDLEHWLNRLVSEGDSLYTHRLEGADDMPAHIRSILTQSDLNLPVRDGRCALGTWQGIYLWEHRHRGHRRSIIVTLQGE